MLKIRHKLFLMMMAATGGVVLCMYLVMQWSFDTGFLRYINQQQEQKLDALAKALSAYWDEDAQWQTLRRQPRLWHETVQKAMNPTAELPPPPPRPMNDDPEQGDNRLPEYFGNRDGFSGRPPPLGRQKNRPGAVPPTLLDEMKKRVFGPRDWARLGQSQKNNPLRFIPVMKADKIIGYLAYRHTDRISNEFNLAFAEQQQKSFLIIAVLMIMITMLLSIPAARQLVKPVQRLIAGTRKLTTGKFDSRIAVTSRDELGELSTHFNALAKTLEQNEGARKRWVADISHELRTPLAVLKGEIEAMQDGIRPMTTESLASLQSEVQQLSYMVGDLYELSMSDIGALNYKMQPVAINPLLQTTVESFTSRLQQAGLTLSMHLGSDKKVQVFGDEARLKQLFNNLLTNTLRYTDSPGQLSITLTLSSQVLHLNWEDSSPGVEPSQLPKLFERLYRVEASRNRAGGGAGLGLAICQNIVKAHDGEVQVSSSLLGGLCVSIHLPIYSK